jgi:hypothetical protein
MRRRQQGRRPRQKPGLAVDADPFCSSEKTDKRQIEAELRHFVKSKYKEEPEQSVFSRREYFPTLNCITTSPYYRFALRFAGNFLALQAEPNLVIDWGKVSKVTRMTYDQYQCPICLESIMTAPRITKCGHCFCYPCVLRYFILDDQHHKRCPVCFDTVKKSWLRPVVIQSVEALKESQVAEFVLLRRRRGAVAVERCGVDSTGFTYQGFFESRSNQATYNRITLHLDEKHDITSSLAELRTLTARTDWDEKELKSIRSAEETLQARLSLLPEDDSVSIVSYFAPACSCTSVYHPLTLELIAADSCPTHPAEQERPCQSSTYDLSELPATKEPDRSSDAFTYFYSLADGQPVFIHPLNVSMLKREFVEYCSFPASLAAPVLELQRVVVTEAEHKRQK